METLVAITRRKNQHQCSGRNRGNCIQPEAELPNTMRYYSMTTPVISRSFSALSPPTSSGSVNRRQQSLKRNGKNYAISIPSNATFEYRGSLMNNDFGFSERWAGPTYSNSPPPSSLPIPKFSIQPRPSVSFHLDSSPSETELYFVTESVHSSSIRGSRCFPGNLFESADSATQTLRRILNLDGGDD